MRLSLSVYIQQVTNLNKIMIYIFLVESLFAITNWIVCGTLKEMAGYNGF